MKTYILFIALFSFNVLFPSNNTLLEAQKNSQNPIDRKLSSEEEQSRGLDILAKEIIESIDKIDIKKMARSAIFETSYGFRWKMVNLHNKEKVIIKVDKDFKLISAHDSRN